MLYLEKTIGELPMINLILNLLANVALNATVKKVSVNGSSCLWVTFDEEVPENVLMQLNEHHE